MSFLIAKKIEMTQQFGDDGVVTPMTVLQVDSCVVTQVKTKEKDGINAVQVGLGVTKKQSKPRQGHLKDLPSVRHLREFPVSDPSTYSRGQVLTVETFAAGQKVKATGVSKGRGFQGVVKRHKFKGSPATHGHKDQLRMPGSIGAGGVQRVIKGMRMAGRMGGERVTVRNLTIVSVDPEKKLIYVKGAVPGPRNSTISLQSIS